MRDDADFAAYVAARWPFLVRSLVLIGCPQPEAEDLVLTGLARCYPSWNRHGEDVDIRVYGEVVDGYRRHHAAGDVDPAPVLRVVAGLNEAQVAEVLDVPVWEVGDTGGEGLLRRAEEIEVRAASYDAVVARAGELRRRRRRRVLVGAVAVVVVGAGLTWFSTRPGPEPDVPEVVTAKNPIALPWYGDGRLQLRNVAVELPEVSMVVAAGGGAVVADADGDLSFVGPTGVVTEIGRTPLGSPVVASDERSWVAWVSSEGDTELVVHDVVDDRDVARVGVLPGATPVALDQNRVFFMSEGRTHVWEPLTGRVEDIGSRMLLDVESAVRVYGNGVRVDIVQPFFNVYFRRPGTTAAMSPGGTFVQTRLAGQLGAYEPIVYDARSGNSMPTGVAPGERVLDSAFGPDGTFVSLVVRSDEDAIAVLRTCHLGTPDCTDIAPLRRDEVEPHLAH